MPTGQEQLQQELVRSLPTCRKGEGFADLLETDTEDITGRAVPYGRTISLFPGLLEEFTAGSFERQVTQPHRIKLCLEHGQVVGRVTELTEKNDGLYFRAKVSDNPGIPEAARFKALVNEGLADELSIGFQTVKDGTNVETLDNGDTKYVHSRARLLEISLVPWGAYGRGATLRSAQLLTPGDVERERMVAAQRAWIAAYRARKTF